MARFRIKKKKTKKTKKQVAEPSWRTLALKPLSTLYIVLSFASVRYHNKEVTGECKWLWWEQVSPPYIASIGIMYVGKSY